LYTALACLPSLLIYKHGFIFLDQLGFAGPRWLLAMLFVVAPLAGRPAGCCHRRDCSIFLGDVYFLNGTVVVGALLALLWFGFFSPAFGFGLFSRLTVRLSSTEHERCEAHVIRWVRGEAC
jgi:hypothetical protein